MSETGELTPKQIAKIWKETEKKLAKEGLAPITESLQKEMNKAGLEGDSYDKERERTLTMQYERDKAVEDENLRDTDLVFLHGLPPCLAAEELDKRGESIGRDDKK